MQMLTELVERKGGTLCLVGDPAQLAPVEGTSPLHSIATRYGYAQMVDIRRQNTFWAQRAAKLFAKGAVAPALAMFAERNLVRTDDDIEDVMNRMCLDWTAQGLTTPEKAIILTSTNEESEKANQICQKHRALAGCINTKNWLEVTDVNEEDDVTYRNKVHVGDRVLCTRNSTNRSGYGVNNGSLGTVVDVNTMRRVIYVRLDNGRHAAIPVHKYPHLRLGYATTTYKAQGSTRPHVSVFASGSEMQNLAASYVQATRGKEDTVFYTTKALINDCLEEIETSPLAQAMSRDVDLTLASDLLPNDETASHAHSREIKRLLDTWKQQFVVDPERAIIVASNCRDTERLNWGACWIRNSYLRDTAKPTLVFKETTYAEGDRVRFLKPSMGHAISGQELGTVTAIDIQQRRLDIKLARGSTVQISLEAYPHIEHAYAVMEQQAFGLEVENALVMRGVSKSPGPSLDPETLQRQASLPAKKNRSQPFKAKYLEYFGDLQYDALAASLEEKRIQALQALNPMNDAQRQEPMSSRTEHISELLETWNEYFVAAPHRALIVAATPEEAEMMNLLAAQMRESHVIRSAKPCMVYEGVTYAEGDRVRFLKPASSHGIRGEELGIVRGVNSAHGILVIKPADGPDIEVRLAVYPHIEHAYAVTESQAWGTQVENALILQGAPESKKPFA